METTIRHVIAERIAAAEQALTAHTGGVNVCRLQQSGRVTGGIKYDEGRLVALNGARRLLERTADAHGALAHELETWRAALADQQARERPAIAWIAYRQGGVDALEDLVALLDGEEHR